MAARPWTPAESGIDAMDNSALLDTAESNDHAATARAPRGQTLWHLTKNGLPGITAVLTRNGPDYELDIRYGHIAQQRIAFAGPLPAAARAEALRDRLEAAGYRRERRDKRRRPTG